MQKTTFQELAFYTEPTTGEIFELMADGFSMIEERFEMIEYLLQKKQDIPEVA